MEQNSIKLSTSDIKPYKFNNKIHTAEQIEQIRKSIIDNGYVQNIVVDEKNIIVIGHGRFEAIKQLQEMGSRPKEIEVTQLIGYTDKQIRKLRIIDNKTNAMTGFDLGNLKIELMEIGDVELNELFLGEIDLADELEEQRKEMIEDKVPEIPEDIWIKEGDYIEIGRHRLLCGDSTRDEDVQKLLQGKNDKITHCISDPPYGIKYDNKKVNGFGMIKNDDKILDYCHLAKKYSNGFFAMRTGHQVVDKRKQLIEKHFEKLNNMIIRHKGGGGMGDCAKTLAQDYEILLVVNRGNEIQGYRGGSVWYRNEKQRQEMIEKGDKVLLKNVIQEISKGEVIWKVGKDNSTEYMHPTQKPVEINDRVLTNFTASGDNVLDLFGGSGSNMISCEKNNRTCYMMELDPKYVQVIIKRMQEYEPKIKVKVNGKNI